MTNQIRINRIAKSAVAFSAAAILSYFSASPAAAGGLSRDLDRLIAGKTTGSVRCIVRANGLLTGELLTALGSGKGRVKRILTSQQSAATSLPVALIKKIAGRPDVALVTRDLVTRPSQSTVDAGAAAVAASSTGLDGTGIGVAIIDSGIAPHTDFTSPVNRIVGWVDLVNGQPTPYDDFGHGTHVAGIVAGSGSGSAGSGYSVRGVAPGANLIGVKVLDANGAGRVSTAIAGIDWCVDNRLLYNIRIINLSLGAPAAVSWQNDPFAAAVHRAWAAGIVVVTAAGNYGRQVASDPNSGIQYGAITAPANAPLPITVGATKDMGTLDSSDDLMATFSSRGPTFFDRLTKPDLVASGNRVLAPISETGSLAGSQAASVIRGTSGATYLPLSGTSQASPAVAGTAALMLQNQPAINPDTVKIRLMHSAVKNWNPTTTFTVFDRGAGLLNVTAAVTQQELATESAATPHMVRDAATQGRIDLVNGRPLWGNDSTLWGNSFLWGDDDELTGGDPGTGGLGTAPVENSTYLNDAVYNSSTIWGDGSDVTPGDPNTTQNSFLWGDDDEVTEPGTTGSNSFLWGDDDEVTTSGEG